MNERTEASETTRTNQRAAQVPLLLPRFCQRAAIEQSKWHGHDDEHRLIERARYRQ